MVGGDVRNVGEGTWFGALALNGERVGLTGSRTSSVTPSSCPQVAASFVFLRVL